MSRPLRLEHEGAVWHITSRGNEKRDIFRCDKDRRLFLDLLAQTVVRCHWLLHTYTLMDNHFHLIIETPQCTLSKGMHWLNSTYAQYFNREYERCGHLYQGRFQSAMVENQGYLNEARRYTVLNPVRAGMVTDPSTYVWSSYRAHAGLEPIPEWLYSNWLFDLDRDPVRCHEIYRDYVAERIGSSDSIWENLVGQIYLGSEEWIARIRKLVESKPRSDEHPETQRLIPRLKMANIVTAVAHACAIDRRELQQGHGGVARRIAAWIAWNEGLLRLREIAASLLLRSSGYVSTLIRTADAELAGDMALQRLARDAIAML